MSFKFVKQLPSPEEIKEMSPVTEEMKKVKTITEEQILKDKRNGKYQLDLWKANEAVCLSAGIRPEHISVTDICTCCNPGYLFSHRASNGKRGNLGMFVVLN